MPLDIGLHPDRIAVGQRDGSWVVEAAHSAKGAENMVKGAVFLHEDNNVFGIQKTAAGPRFDGKGSADRLQAILHDANTAGQAGRNTDEIAPGVHDWFSIAN